MGMVHYGGMVLKKEVSDSRQLDALLKLPDIPKEGIFHTTVLKQNILIFKKLLNLISNGSIRRMQ